MTGRLMVETSALVAIILEEPEWRAVAEQITGGDAFTSCVNVFEATLAIVRQRALTLSEAHEVVIETVTRLGVDVRALELGAIPRAVEARERFGAGRHALNMGDCLSYAAARHAKARLLYVGQDFSRTDVNVGL